jgi:hypothetical protein
LPLYGSRDDHLEAKRADGLDFSCIESQRRAAMFAKCPDEALRIGCVKPPGKFNYSFH